MTATQNIRAVPFAYLNTLALHYEALTLDLTFFYSIHLSFKDWFEAQVVALSFSEIRVCPDEFWFGDYTFIPVLC
jgi:hypothetical protein